VRGETKCDALRDIDDPQAAIERCALDRFDISKTSQRLGEESGVCRLRHHDHGALSFRVAWLDGILHSHLTLQRSLPHGRQLNATRDAFILPRMTTHKVSHVESTLIAVPDTRAGSKCRRNPFHTFG